MSYSRRRPAFTLIELLVVIAIIGILVALLMPAVQRVREAANRTQCKNNLKQQALALQLYHDQWGSFPPAVDNKFTIYWHWSWLARILPYIEQQGLYDEAFAFASNTSTPVDWPGPGYAHWSPWGGYVWGLKIPQNPAIAKPVKAYTCPSDIEKLVVEFKLFNGDPLKMAYGHYQGCSGLNYKTQDGALGHNDGVRIADVIDGTSNTLLIGERSSTKKQLYGAYFAGCGQTDRSLPEGDDQRGSGDIVLGVRELNSGKPAFEEIKYCPPGPYHFQPPGLFTDPNGKALTECDLFHFWSRHPGGANFAMVDGSVHFFAYSADRVMPELGTRAGQEAFEFPN